MLIDRAKKPHPTISAGNRRDGPASPSGLALASPLRRGPGKAKRPKTSLAMEISVGKSAARLPRKESSA